jgi:hypothetical protein
MAIEGIRARRPVSGPAGHAPIRAGGGGFSIQAGSLSEVETAATAGPAGIAAAGILALQETAPETVGDRPARRRGQDMLDELAALQRDLLTPTGPSPGTLRRLARLATDPPEATTQGLRDAVAAIRLRAVVELTRYGLME